MFKWANLNPNVSSRKEYKESVFSPDDKIECRFIIKQKQPFYMVFKNNLPIIKLSKLDFKVCGLGSIFDGLELSHVKRQHHDEIIEMLWGEDRFIDNNFTESTFYFSKSPHQKPAVALRFRIFNNAVAFRYEILSNSKHKRFSVERESTEFNIETRSTVWKIPAYQPNRYEYKYERATIGDLQDAMHTPLTVKISNGYYLSIHEAALYDYGAMNLKLGREGILKSDITPLSDGTKAHIELPFNTPWRLIMIADSAIELTSNRTMYALNEPPAADFGWVKTLQFIGIWWAMYVGEWTWAKGDKHGATTEHAMEYIDAAVRLGVSGLLIEGWNEAWEGDWLQNGINNKFTTATPDFDFERVARYARKNHIELVGHHETVGFIDNYERQLENAYNYYAANGVHYIKTGYAGEKMTIHGRHEFHYSQLGVNHYQKTIELAARKHICLDIHEPVKGTGTERTFPNLLSREGARGQEYEGGVLTPSHACYLPYTRLLAGGMDYTCGILDLSNSKKPIYTTLARQLAYFVVIYSGMQMAADRPFIYEERFKSEFDFIQSVPTNYETTIPIAGEIGEYYIVARKSRDANEWFIGGVTADSPRSTQIRLDFIGPGNYVCDIYEDAADAHYRKNPFAIKKQTQLVNSDSTLELFMAPGGGFAARIRPQE